MHSFPALTEAAGHGYRFDWVVEEAFVDLAAMHPAVDTVLPFGLRRWRRRPFAGLSELATFVRQLRGRSYSKVLDAQGLVKSSFVGRVSGAAERIGLDADSAREPLSARLHTSAVKVGWDQHAIDRLRLLFASALNYSVDVSTPVPSPFATNTSLGIQTTGASPIQKTVLIHGTTWRSKEYPEIAWRVLIDRLLEAGHAIALVSGSATEYERAQRLCGNLKEQSARVEALPLGSLADAAAHVLDARLVIGIDSGLTHLAAVLGRPTIGLYGATDADRTGVRGPLAADLTSDFFCSPCMQRECSYQGRPEFLDDAPLVPACFSKITAEQVMRAVEKLDVNN